MKTPQLLAAALLVVSAAPACSRTESDPNAQRKAEQVKAAAARAGHQLADSWLTTKIQAQYFADDDIKARHINVSTRDAVVTLTGFVDNQPQRDLAAQIARTTDGVRQVNDRLTIRGSETGAVATSGALGASGASGAPGAGAPAPNAPAPNAPNAPSAPNAPNAPSAPNAPDDALVTARVQSKFFVDERVKGRRIDVDTQNGVVTLTGEVADEQERAQALLLARTADGVVRVEDHLVVAPTSQPAPAAPASGAIDDATLTTTIQAKYFVDTTVKGSAIDVSAKDGVVLLQGSVASDAARTQALAIAQNTPGVVQVVDRLTVAAARGR